MTENKYQEQPGQSPYLQSLIKKSKRIIVSKGSHAKINSHFCVISSKRYNQYKQDNDSGDQSFRPLKCIQSASKPNICHLTINQGCDSPTRKNNYIGIVQLKRPQVYEHDKSITPYQNRKRTQTSASKYRKNNKIMLKRALATFLEESKNKWLIVKQATYDSKTAKQFELSQEDQANCTKSIINIQHSKNDIVTQNYQQSIKNQGYQQKFPKQSIKKLIPSYKNKKAFRNTQMTKKKESKQDQKNNMYEVINLSRICDTKMQITQLGIHEKLIKNYSPKRNSNFKNKLNLKKQGKTNMQDTMILSAKISTPLQQLEKTIQKSLQGVINFSKVSMRRKQQKQKIRPQTADKSRKLYAKSPSRYQRNKDASQLLQVRGWDNLPDLPETNQKDIDFL